MKHTLLSFLPAFIWSIVILILSIGPGVNLPESWWDLFSPDKVGHLTVYGILTFLLLRGFLNKNQNLSQTIVVIALGISIFYGILMELMQYGFFPHRYFEIYDIIANIIGSFLGWKLFNYTLKPR